MNNRLDTALTKPEAGVAEPTRKRSGSFTAQIRDLELGQSASRVVQINATHTLFDIQEHMAAWKSDLRSSVESTAGVVRRDTGHKYTTELADFRTASHTWFIVAVVTRVE